MGKLGKPVTQRQLRVGEMIKQALSMIFLKDEAKIPNINTKERDNSSLSNTHIITYSNRKDKLKYLEESEIFNTTVNYIIREGAWEGKYYKDGLSDCSGKETPDQQGYEQFWDELLGLPNP